MTQLFNVFNSADIKLLKKIQHQFEGNEVLKRTHLDVSVSDGVVVLRGQVPHAFEKMNAESIVQQTAGTRAVVNEIEIEMMGSFDHTDEQIAHAIVTALRWSYPSPKSLVVQVHQGWVTINGQADYEYQKTAALSMISQMMGVKGITDFVQVGAEQVHPNNSLF
jgi:osmotically-inducible protein OsmY